MKEHKLDFNEIAKFAEKEMLRKAKEAKLDPKTSLEAADPMSQVRTEARNRWISAASDAGSPTGCRTRTPAADSSSSCASRRLFRGLSKTCSAR